MDSCAFANDRSILIGEPEDENITWKICAHMRVYTEIVLREIRSEGVGRMQESQNRIQGRLL